MTVEIACGPTWKAVSPSLPKWSGRSSALRLLLREAMQRPLAPHEVDGVDAHHLSIGKELRQGLQHLAIARIVEGRHEYDAVRDVEVGVTRGEPLTGHEPRAREG